MSCGHGLIDQRRRAATINLKGRPATAAHRGVDMEQWQYEVTSAGRIWYLVDSRNRTLWLKHAGPGHPKDTE